MSPTGELTGRGSAYLRGSITGAGTFLGGILHTLRFLIPQYRAALIVAIVVIVFELLTLLDPRALLRHRLPPLVRVGRTRRRDHRVRQRRTLMQKDVALALDTGRELRVPLPSAGAADGVLTVARAFGYEGRDIAARYEVLARLTSDPVRSPA